MADPGNAYPEYISCPACESLLELEEEERSADSITCPSCSFEIKREQQGESAFAKVEKPPEEHMLLPPGAPNQHESTFGEKLVFTLAAVAIYRVGLQIPVPGLDATVLRVAAERGRDIFGQGVFSQGITPYLVGSVAILLLSVALPSLRRLRDGTSEQNRQFDRVVYWGVLVCSMVMAWRSYDRLRNISVGDDPVTSGGLLFFIVYVMISAAGTMLLVWLADRVTQRGLVNGVALFVLTDAADRLFRSEGGIFRAMHAGVTSDGTGILLLLIPVGLLLGSVLLLQGKRSIILERAVAEAGDPYSAPPSYAVPIRVMAAGIMPFVLVPAVISSLLYYYGLTATPYWLIYAVLMILISMLFIAVIYDPRDLVARLKRFGYKVAETRTDKEAEAYLDAVLLKTTVPGIAFVLALTMLPTPILNSHGITASFFAKDTLTMAAIVIGMMHNLKGMRWDRIRSVSGSAEESARWLPVYATDIAMEAELVRVVLSDLRIRSALRANRVISVTGTFAPWEICRPRFPSLMIHPRLGGGAVEVLVPAEALQPARDALASRGIVGDTETDAHRPLQEGSAMEPREQDNTNVL